MRCIIFVLLVLPLAGCGLEILGAAAIGSSMDAQNAKQGFQAINYAKQVTGKLGPQEAIQAYRAEKGVNPPSLEAMVREGYLTEIPKQPDGSPYGYDPATGNLLEGRAAASPAPALASPAALNSNDALSLQALRSAVATYARANGKYPPALQVLAPRYMLAVPKASNGQDFTYDPLAGAVYPPGGAPQGGGAGMAGAVTGLGMQQQLNAMSNAGASSAGSRMRGGAQGIADTHTQQQEKTMNDMGM